MLCAFAFHVFANGCLLYSSCYRIYVFWGVNDRNPESRVVRHPGLAVPHLSLAHIGHLDFEGLKAMGCKGIIFDKVSTKGRSSVACLYRRRGWPLV